MNKGKLTIGFIGAGRVGFTLGRYFFDKNLEISGFFSKTYEHSCGAAEFTHSKPYKTIRDLVADSQIIFITVPDTNIYDVYLQIKKYNIKDKIICHCSGALSTNIFEGIEDVGAYAYSVHPVFAINDKKESYKKLSNAFFTVEGNEEKMPVIKEIFETIENPFQVISAENKNKYHAALVMSSNLVIGLYHTSLKLLEECGFSYLDANEVLKPLFLNNAENLYKNGCINALTGPIDRNDIKTVNRHLSSINNNLAIDIYKLLSSEVLEIAKQKYPNRDYEELEKNINKE